MGSIDIPPFMKEKMKQDIQAQKSDIPPFLQKKNGGEDVTTDLQVGADGQLEQSVPTTLQSTLPENDYSFDPLKGIVNKKPIVNVGGVPIPIDTPFPLDNSNKNQFSQGLQERINTKTYSPEDVNVVAKSMKVSPLAASAYMDGKVGTGTVIHFNDIKTKKGNQLKATVAKANQELGRNDNYDEIFASPELVGSYLHKIQKIYEDKANKESVSAVEKSAQENPILFGEGLANVNDSQSKETLNAAQEIKNIISNDIIEKISTDTNLNKNQKVKKIYNLVDNRDAKNVQKAIANRLEPFRYMMDVALGGNTEKGIELLNANKASIEFKLNRTLGEQINLNDARKKMLTEEYASKVESGEVSPEDETARDYYAKQISDIDATNTEIAKDVVPDKDLYEKYPVLYKSAVANTVNEFNAIKSGNVQGYEGGGYKDITVFEHLKANGFDINDQRVKDVIEGDNLKDYSFFGRPLQNVLEVFTNTAKSLGDLTGIRDAADILAEKKEREIFPTQVGAKDEFQLTTAASTAQNIANTTGQIIGQGLLQLGTAGLGRMAGLSKVAANGAAFWSSGTLTSYDAAYKDSYDFVDSEVGRTAYAGLIALANGASERIFPEIKLFQIPGVKDAIADLSKKVGTKEFTTELADELLGKAKNAFVNYGLKYGKNVSQETIEEVSTDLFESGTRFLFGDQNINVAKAIENAKNTAIQTAIGTSLIGGFGTNRDVRNERNVSAKSTIYNAAIYHDEALDAINQGFNQKLYNEYERDAKIAVLNTARQSVDVMDKTEQIEGKTLDRPEKELYVANLTAEATLTAQKKGMDEIGQKAIDVKVSNLQNQRQQILNGEVLIDENGNVSVPEKATPLSEQPIVAVSDVEILPTLEKVKQVIPEENLVATQGILTRVNNAENINENEIETAQDELYTALDTAPEAAHLIEPLILKLQDYEFTTKTEVSTVTEERAVEVVRPVIERKEVNKSISQWEGNRATITDANGNAIEGVINLEDGKYYLKNENGEKVAALGETAITDRDITLPSTESVPTPIQFDENGDIKSMTLQLNKLDKEKGGTISDKLITINFRDKEKALDYAIALRAEQIGEVPQPLFDTIYEQVQREIKTEVPITKSVTKENATNKQASIENKQGNVQTEAAKPTETIVTETIQPTKTFTEKEQLAIDAIMGKEFKGGIKNWTDVIQSETSTPQNKKQALKELTEQLIDPNSEDATGTALGQKVSDAIYELEKKQTTKKATVTPTATTVAPNVPTLVTKARELAKQFRAGEKNVLPEFMRANLPEGTKLSGIDINQAWADALDTFATVYEASKNFANAIDEAFNNIKDWFTDNNIPIDENKLKTEFSTYVKTQTPEPNVKEIADLIRKDEITYNDAIDGQDQSFIDALNTNLFGSKKFNFDTDRFKEQVRRQKSFGLTEEEIVKVFEASKKLTKVQKGLIAEVFGETAETDAIAKELQEAFKQLAKGEKPKSVLKRLSVSNVTEMVNALSDALKYTAVSNDQLDKMADFIVDAIDLNKADQFINAMISNSIADVRQLVRAKLIVALQKSGNKTLATKLVREMADEATQSGRQTQSLKRAYEILGAQGNPATRTEFARRMAEVVQEKARKMTERYGDVISEQKAEIGRLNERLHQKTQTSPLINKIKDVIATLCGLRNKAK